MNVVNLRIATIRELKEAIIAIPEETLVYACGTNCALKIQFDDEGDEVVYVNFDDADYCFEEEADCA